MRRCEQTHGLNILEHGESVARYYADLLGNRELLWIPLIDKPEDTVTVPLTFVGA